MGILDQAKAKRAEIERAKSAIGQRSPDEGAADGEETGAKSAITERSPEHPEVEVLRHLYPRIKRAVDARDHMGSAAAADIEVLRDVFRQGDALPEEDVAAIVRDAGPAVLAWALIEEYRERVERMRAEGYDVAAVDGALRKLLTDAVTAPRIRRGEGAA